MKSVLLAFIGLLVGGIFGVFFGAVFGIAVTKKSQRELTQQIQMPIFGVMGAVLGVMVGAKLGEEEEKEYRPIQKQRQMAPARAVSACKNCKIGIGHYSNEAPPYLCHKCSVKLVSLVRELLSVNEAMNEEISLANDDETKIKCLERIALAAEKVKVFEELGLNCVSPPASEIIDHTFSRIWALMK